MTEGDHGTVRITNAQIFDEMRQLRTDVGSLKQSMEETVRPGLGEFRSDVRALDKGKADVAEVVKLEGSINSVRVQAYAIGSGVLAGLLALRTLGVI